MELQGIIKNNIKTITSVKELVNFWINSKSTRNATGLARSCEVSEACIRRVLNSNALPMHENLFKIVSFIFNDLEKAIILEHCTSEFIETLKVKLPYLNFTNNSYNAFTIKELECILTDFPKRIIFELSSINSGLPVEKAIEMFGSYSDSIIEEFINKKIVSIVDNKIVCDQTLKNHVWSTSFSKKLCVDSINYFYKENSNLNFLFLQNEGISVKAYGEIMDILSDASKKIYNIILENPGEIPASISCTLDTLTFESVFKKDLQ